MTNIEICFEIHNIRELHHPVHDEEKRSAAIAAAEQFVKDHHMEYDDMMIDFKGEDGYLVCYTPDAISVKRVFDWLEHVTAEWEKMAKRVLGPNCEPRVEVDWVDEE